MLTSFPILKPVIYFMWNWIICYPNIYIQITDTAVPIVDPVLVTDVAATAEQILQPVKEIPFTELGLGGYTPIGLLQSAMEFLHMSVGLPWWGTIIVGKDSNKT